MAKSVEIISNKNTFKLTIDGNEIEGVQEYSIDESLTRRKTLTIKIAVTDKLSVNHARD